MGRGELELHSARRSRPSSSLSTPYRLSSCTLQAHRNRIRPHRRDIQRVSKQTEINPSFCPRLVSSHSLLTGYQLSPWSSLARYASLRPHNAFGLYSKLPSSPLLGGACLHPSFRRSLSLLSSRLSSPSPSSARATTPSSSHMDCCESALYIQCFRQEWIPLG